MWLFSNLIYLHGLVQTTKKTAKHGYERRTIEATKVT